MDALLGALRFLTRIPIPGNVDVPYRRAVPWFPIAGVLIGTSVGGAAVLLDEYLHPTLAAAIAVVLGLLITGAFHEDGLADVADAFGGGWNREQRLEILKDSRHGTYGVAALCSSIVIRVLAVAVILGGAKGQASAFAGLVSAHALGRAAAVGVLASVRSASPSAEGLAVSSRTELSAGAVAVGVAFALALSAVALGWWVVPAGAGAVVAAVAVSALALRKIGGVVGDVLGATEQVAECLVLIVIAGLVEHHALWWA